MMLTFHCTATDLWKKKRIPPGAGNVWCLPLWGSALTFHGCPNRQKKILAQTFAACTELFKSMAHVIMMNIIPPLRVFFRVSRMLHLSFVQWEVKSTSTVTKVLVDYRYLFLFFFISLCYPPYLYPNSSSDVINLMDNGEERSLNDEMCVWELVGLHICMCLSVCVCVHASHGNIHHPVLSLQRWQKAINESLCSYLVPSNLDCSRPSPSATTAAACNRLLGNRGRTAWHHTEPLTRNTAKVKCLRFNQQMRCYDMFSHGGVW